VKEWPRLDRCWLDFGHGVQNALALAGSGGLATAAADGLAKLCGSYARQKSDALKAAHDFFGGQMLVGAIEGSLPREPAIEVRAHAHRDRPLALGGAAPCMPCSVS
jgi:hypothetical protein